MGNVFQVNIGYLEQWKNILYHYKKGGFDNNEVVKYLSGLKKGELIELKELSQLVNMEFGGIITDILQTQTKLPERQYTNTDLSKIFHNSRQTINNWSKKKGLVNVGTEEKGSVKNFV